jgi:hypothetical protein
MCELEGAQFKGKVVIRDAVLGEEFSASDAWFGGDCELRRVKIPGDDPLAGALFTRTPTVIDTYLPRPITVQKSDEDEEPEPAPDDGEGPE